MDVAKYNINIIKSSNLTHHFVRGDLPVLGEHLLQLLFSQFISEVLDEDIGELLGLLSELFLTLLARDKPPDKHLASEMLIDQLRVGLDNNIDIVTFFSLSSMPLTFWIAFMAASSVSKWTNPYPW